MSENGAAPTKTRRRPRRRVATFPAVQSLPSVTYTETPVRHCTIGCVDDSSWCCKPVMLQQSDKLEWIIAATDQGDIVFWKLQKLPKNNALNVTVPPTQSLSVPDRIVQLIPQDVSVLAITIVGKVYTLSLVAELVEGTNKYWALDTKWDITDEDLVNIRRVIVWNKETMICATESFLMAWSASKECLWKHRIDNIMAMELLGDSYVIVVPHGRAVQVLDIRELSKSVLEATVLARPGLELLPSTTEGATILYRRERDSHVVLAFSDGQCFLVGVMEDDGVGEWGVVGKSLQLPFPAVGIGLNQWGDILFCLPAGSTIAADITGRMTAAWMLPIGAGEHEDTMIPVEGFCAAGGVCLYQWPNGVMDIFSVQTSCQQLLASLVAGGLAQELMNWLLQVEAPTLALHGANYTQAQQELEKMETADIPTDELLRLAPSFRRCLLALEDTTAK